MASGDFLPGYGEPFPSRDRIVEKDGSATDIFTRYMEQSLLQRLNQTSYRVPSVPAQPGVVGSGVGTLVANAVGGQYRISIYREVVSADPVSSSLAIVIAFTHNGKALTRSASAFAGAPQTANDNAGDTIVIDVDAGTPISYTATYASNTPALAQFYLSFTPELIQATS